MRNISIFYTRDIQSTILEKNQLFSSATNNHLEISINFAITITPAYKNIPPSMLPYYAESRTKETIWFPESGNRRPYSPPFSSLPLIFLTSKNYFECNHRESKLGKWSGTLERWANLQWILISLGYELFE